MSEQDALVETQKVLLELRHYLSMVRRNAHLKAKADLKDIEVSLGNVADRVGFLTRKEKPAEMLQLVQAGSKHS